MQLAAVIYKQHLIFLKTTHHFLHFYPELKAGTLIRGLQTDDSTILRQQQESLVCSDGIETEQLIF